MVFRIGQKIDPLQGWGLIQLLFLGSGPDRGQSPVEWEDFPFVRSSIHLSVRLFSSLGWMDGRTDGRMENLPILQDFVPYRGRCPKREL